MMPSLWHANSSRSTDRQHVRGHRSIDPPRTIEQHQIRLAELAMMAGRNEWKLIIASGLLMLSFLAAPQKHAVSKGLTDDDRARDSMTACERELRSLDSGTLELGICLGIVRGLHYLSADICVPPALSMVDLAEILVRFFDSHPSDPLADFRERSLEAMRSTWPCGARKDI
jgi:hypothetical protein